MCWSTFHVRFHLNLYTFHLFLTLNFSTIFVSVFFFSLTQIIDNGEAHG